MSEFNAASLEQSYALARERYAGLGVDTEQALATLATLSPSLHCWQGDDVAGFERAGATLAGGGIQVTGHYPGKARDVAELRADMEKALSLIPGRQRVNLHAIYGEFGGKAVDRDAIEPQHFAGWIEWARALGVKLDFNATCFSHPRADAGFTLSSKDAGCRRFWIEHVRRCREIAATMGRAQGAACVHNLWIPDGTKDAPADRWGQRALLKEALDEIFAAEYAPAEMKDALECKLFGIGSEAYVVGSHEFYMGYALTRGKMLCLDMGHFHPTESVADKVSAILQFSDELLLHLSRGVRWDSDHVVILGDEMRAVAEECVRSGRLGSIHLALDYFDASMNRIGAWVIGARAALKAFLLALLQPAARLRQAEEAGDFFTRLALLEDAKALPFGAVWEYYCWKMGAPGDVAWQDEVRQYEQRVLSRRAG